MSFKFEKLIGWQKAVDLSDVVSQVTKSFPKDEIYVLTLQMKRAADSVSLNRAEGSTGILTRSLTGLLALLFVRQMKWWAVFTWPKDGDIFLMRISIEYKICEEILMMINALRNSLK